MENKTRAEIENKLAVVLPAYCEADKIGDTVRSVLNYCPNVIVVDDGSPDRTAEIAKAAGARHVIVHQQNQGKGIALQTGFDHALKQGFEWIITIDADGQHNPADISKFVDQFEQEEVDVLVGNRMTANRNMPWIRRRTNQFMSWLLSRIMHQKVPDTQNGYRGYHAKVIPYLKTQSTGFAAESEQLLHIADRGLKIGSVAVETIYSDEESSIHPLRDTLRFFRMIVQYYQNPKLKCA